MTVKSISTTLDQEAHSTQFGNNYFSSLVAERKTKTAPLGGSTLMRRKLAKHMALTVVVEDDRLDETSFLKNPRKHLSKE